MNVPNDFSEWLAEYRAKKWQTRNGLKRSTSGYLLEHRPEHPHCNNQGYVPIHRLLMEIKMGRYLSKKEEVHHINGNKLDNRIENLQLMSNKSEHTR